MEVPKERRTLRGRQLFDAPAAKPDYRVPLVEEVRALPRNGLTVASLFAGCGGSSLGYRMAGFRVLYANEFVPIAAESYRLNMAEGTVVDQRDVRDVTAESILEACGLAEGELDLLDGSPPCQAFSTAGLRERGWGKERKYSNGKAQRNEDLFFEFVRLRDGLKPRAFVAENVSGLVKGAAKGYFLEILRLLKRGYRVEARVLDAQWLGVPQQRQRVIFVGVREDLALAPAFPSPLPYRYSVRDALPWLGRVVHDTSGIHSVGTVTDRPCPAIINSGSSGGGAAWHFKVEDKVVQKARYDREVDVTDEPALTVRSSDGSKSGQEISVVHGSLSGHSKHRGQEVNLDQPSPAVMARHDGGSRGGSQFEVAFRKRTNDGRNVVERVAVEGANGFNGHRGQGIDRPVPTVQAGRADGPTVERLVQGPHSAYPSENQGREVDLDGASPAILAGNAKKRTPRQFEVEVRKVAKADVVGEHVAASLEGYAVGEEYDRLNPGQASGKFMNLVRPEVGKPCPTITSGGGGQDAAPGGVASVCHPVEKRKFTIFELRRLCSFPDDFQLAGSYAQQWERLGNSVPPLMMRAIAEAVRDRVLLPAAAARDRSSRTTRSGGGKSHAASRRASPRGGSSRA